jgi:uncharacterized membrane protein
MENVIIFKTALILHIIAGSTALLTGFLALVFKKKRNGYHGKAGLVFHYAMVAVSISAFAMAIIKMNYFLFVVGVFSLYLTFAGYRSIKIMKGERKEGLVDQLGMALSALLMVAVTYQFLSTTIFSLTGFSMVILVFDAILVALLLLDLKIFNKSKPFSKNQWLIRHITRMVPAYIATVTAFLVVNVSYEYPVVIWLAPTVLFVPVIIYNIRKYRVRNI